MNGRVRLYRWFARDAEAEGHESPLAPDGPRCPTCGTWLRDGSSIRPCPMCSEVQR